MDAHRLFWLVFFIPVNVVFQGLCYAGRSLQPDLESPILVIVLLKAAYFLMVLYGIFALKRVWLSMASVHSLGIAWVYRAVGLATVAALLAVHAENVYQFGRAEREIHRNLIATNQLLPSAPVAGVRTDIVRLERGDWVYESTITQVSAEQIDKVQVAAAVRKAFSGKVCTFEWNRRLFELGVGVRYVYRDSEGRVIADETFESDICAGEA